MDFRGSPYFSHKTLLTLNILNWEIIECSPTTINPALGQNIVYLILYIFLYYAGITWA